MKKLMYLIVIALILGLVLTGCSLLSNISQVPATGQSGISYLTKNGPLPNLVGLWHFDENAGTTAFDSSVNDNDGEVNGADWVDGKFGYALSFDGSNDYVISSSGPNFDEKSEITISAWVKSGGDQSNKYIVALPELSTGHNGIDLRQVDNSNFGFIVVTHSDNSVSNIGSVDTNWHHLVATYDGVTAKGYFDGAEIVSDPVILGTGLKHGSGEVNIGRFGSGGWYFNGTIDEVRIWNTALTADQLILYGFGGLMDPYAPPKEKTFKVGRTIPLKWQYTNLLGDSSAANPSVEIKRELSNETTPVDGPPIVLEDPGNSGYQYDSETDTWQFNWQTKNCVAGLYKIWIINDWTGQTFGPFPIWLR